MTYGYRAVKYIYLWVREGCKEDDHMLLENMGTWKAGMFQSVEQEWAIKCNY